MITKVLILICAMSLPQEQCTPEKATSVIQGPVEGGFKSAQLFLSGAAGLEVRDDEYVKIIYVMGEK